MKFKRALISDGGITRPTLTDPFLVSYISIPIKPFVDNPKDLIDILMHKQNWTKKKGDYPSFFYLSITCSPTRREWCHLAEEMLIGSWPHLPRSFESENRPQYV